MVAPLSSGTLDDVHLQVPCRAAASFGEARRRRPAAAKSKKLQQRDRHTPSAASAAPSPFQEKQAHPYPWLSPHPGQIAAWLASVQQSPTMVRCAASSQMQQALWLFGQPHEKLSQTGEQPGGSVGQAFPWQSDLARVIVPPDLPKQPQPPYRQQPIVRSAESGVASHETGTASVSAHAAGSNGSAGRRLLLQACWDYHSPAGCTRPSCKWKHCTLDKWQSSWLLLQRFCFGGQVGSFESFAGLAEAVRTAFCDEARLATDTPPSVSVPLGIALGALRDTGYPFEVACIASHGQVVPGGADGACSGRAGRRQLFASLRMLASMALPAGSEVLPVGSYAWGIDTDGSDLDVVIVSPGMADAGQEALDKLCEMLTRLQQAQAAPRWLQDAECARYGRSSVPVLTIRAKVNGELLSVDVCVDQLGSVRDAILFHHLFALTPELRTVLQLLKKWLRARAIPTSCEGGYPQVFWMRLAARTLQQLAGPTPNAAGASSATNSTAMPTSWEALSGTMVGMHSLYANKSDREKEAAHRLRAFCLRWSTGLPGWSELLNLAGEEPCSAVKHLGKGVHGATALLCMRELRNLASLQGAEAFNPVAPHQHLCPAQAGFWAAFLVPAPGADGGGGPTMELIAVRVWRCIGPLEGVRRCSCSSCSEIDRPANSHTASAHEYVSRRDTDWMFLASVVSEGSSAETQWVAKNAASNAPPCTALVPTPGNPSMKGADSEATPQGWPAMSPPAVGSSFSASSAPSLPRRQGLLLGLAPPHFVCQLPGQPGACSQATAMMKSLRSLLAEKAVASSLPQAYPLRRYSRRVLLALRPQARAQERVPSTDAVTP